MLPKVRLILDIEFVILPDHYSCIAFGVYLCDMRVIAYDIANLTDARYFAARGAHAIGFSIVQSTIDEINAIKEWVDVPSFFIRIPEDISAESLWEIQERTGISTFLITSIAEEVSNLFPSANWIKFHADIDNEEDELAFIFHKSISPIENDAKHYVEAQGDIFDEKNYAGYAGLLFSGSDEDKVGLKAYDTIDDFLDQVEVEY